MDILIETPRLLMREFCLDDVDAVFEFSTNPDVMRYTGDMGTVNTKKDAENLIVNCWQAEYKKYGYSRYALIHKEDDKVIGFCGVKYEPDLNCPDIGYRMLPEYWGNGLATEAVKATLEYAINTLGLTKVIGEVLVVHPASGNVLLKSGLRKVDTYEKDGFILNRYE
ncbi:TPA: GNAT family N-acetyltransferase [Shewanella algae]|uniref:GNAT family N-acetyltransferase n=1 Tax=Shewanella algae TaxID=38313 RepID=UPI001C599EFD|nr:GNAT family N-acetyltransferase [Shewanella algae]HDS1201086.1 GNAT family N-acetyltransferase [Shewanella algae]